MNIDDTNPLSVARMVKKADDRLYRTLMFAPLLARLVYALCVAVVAVTGFVLKTRWDIVNLENLKLNKSTFDLHAQAQQSIQETETAAHERNAKIVDQLYKDFYHKEPPPR